MANSAKKRSKRKSEIIGVRVTPKEKERIEALAKIKGVNVTELIREAMDSFLKSNNHKTKEIWKFLIRAAEIIDQEENKERNC